MRLAMRENSELVPVVLGGLTGATRGSEGDSPSGDDPGACIARVFAARSAAAANSFVRSRTDAVAMVAGDSTSRAADVPVAEAGRR